MNDKQKQQLMVALVAFNFTVLAYVTYRFVTAPRMVMDVSTLLYSLLIGAAIGLVTGAIGYFVGGMGK
jgi:Flp pilus assembly protein protease CpaA